MSLKIAAVSYLNSLPLIAGLEGCSDVELFRGVPSSLLETLEQGRADLALCPVIDYQRSSVPLVLVPVGAIGSRNRTLTVRVFSRVEIGRLKCIHIDGDSHSSVALLRIILYEVYGIKPELQPLIPQPSGVLPDEVEAALLIGDKVITSEPSASDFPEQLDLGEAWRRLTGLPFVFAIWMARQGSDLGRIPAVLAAQLEENRRHVDTLVGEWAADHAWPSDLARHYLVDLLDHSAGPAQLEAIELFWRKCHALGLISRLDALRIFDSL